MYAIEWLKDGAVVDRETSILLHEADVVRKTSLRHYLVVQRLNGQEPDSFRVTNQFGEEIGVFKADGTPVATNPLVEPRRIEKVCRTLTPVDMLVV
jgi:hypothetical protein